MTTTATIYDADLNPVSGDFEIHGDDFAAVEKAAAIIGAKCCIRWVRDSDGQASFWGPKGARLTPHWYAPVGRPSEMEGGKRVNVYLDAASLERAAILGGGNVSEGIRRALAPT